MESEGSTESASLGLWWAMLSRSSAPSDFSFPMVFSLVSVAISALPSATAWKALADMRLRPRVWRTEAQPLPCGAVEGRAPSGSVLTSYSIEGRYLGSEAVPWRSSRNLKFAPRMAFVSGCVIVSAALAESTPVFFARMTKASNSSISSQIRWARRASASIHWDLLDCNAMSSYAQMVMASYTATCDCRMQRASSGLLPRKLINLTCAMILASMKL
mmetsp:Transcript_14006/g.40304  ORF Transcript_14006/g.40304 Transcript_14006/m.40304 type:complete len:216 (+) Transcript_14006:489-1136(+)